VEARGLSRGAVDEPSAGPAGLVPLAHRTPHYDLEGARELRGRHVLGFSMTAAAT